MDKEKKLSYADNNRRRWASSQTKRVAWKSKSRHVA